MLENQVCGRVNLGRRGSGTPTAEQAGRGLFEGLGVAEGLTQRLHDHAWYHLLQDFTVGVQGGVGVHFQQPHLGPTLVSIVPTHHVAQGRL